VLIAASVLVPTLQAVLVNGAGDLPFGLDKVRGLIYAITFAAGLVVLFAALCMTYWLVPKGKIPWAAIWPGALGATVAIGVVDFVFPLYIASSSTLRIGASAVFVLIALIWFYALAIILLAGAVVNDLRLAARR
jgi:membrane protein